MGRSHIYMPGFNSSWGTFQAKDQTLAKSSKEDTNLDTLVSIFCDFSTEKPFRSMLWLAISFSLLKWHTDVKLAVVERFESQKICF